MAADLPGRDHSPGRHRGCEFLPPRSTTCIEIYPL